MVYIIKVVLFTYCLNSVPDLPLCLGVLKHRAPFFYDGFLLMWCDFKFEGILFRSDSRHNDRVDSLLSLPPSGP